MPILLQESRIFGQRQGHSGTCALFQFVSLHERRLRNSIVIGYLKVLGLRVCSFSILGIYLMLRQRRTVLFGRMSDWC